MQTLLIATALMMFMSGSAFADTWSIPLEEVSVPLKNYGKALDNGKRDVGIGGSVIGST
ncbi:MAG: hypothetical protein VCB14_05605 [Alphaproteobacteria bacterium]